MDKDGIYAVGTDIAPGIYSTAGPVGSGTCYWKRTGNPDGALIDNSSSKKSQVVQIEPTDKAFKTIGMPALAADSRREPTAHGTAAGRARHPRHSQRPAGWERTASPPFLSALTPWPARNTLS